MRTYFFNNTDPDGMHRVLATIAPELGKMLLQGGFEIGRHQGNTKGMLEAKAYYEASGLNFGKHAIASTRKESELDRYVRQNGWVATFPMWDCVGGRTSELSVVGLSPAALQGIDIDSMINGASACDEATRAPTFSNNLCIADIGFGFAPVTARVT